MPPSTALARRDWLWLLLIWALAAGTLLYRSNAFKSGLPFFIDTDDAMRMVVVRDFLGGQGWYDLVQHRLNTPFGAEIHWSRLIDVPLAALLSLAGLFWTEPTALVVTGTLWPLLLLAILLWLSVRCSIEIAGRETLLPALVLPVLSPPLLSEFTPGRVDHHNVIIVLTMAMLLASLVALRRPLAAWLAGLLAATALAIAIESLPVVVATILAFGLAFAFDAGHRRNLLRFGLSFGLGTALHLALTRMPSRWFEAACDMISPVYVLAALAVGTAFAIIALLPPARTPLLRFATLAVFGLLAAGLVALVYPQCLAGPYGELDPWLQRNWIGAIVEAKPWHVTLFELPAYSVVVAIPVVLGVLVATIACWRLPQQRLQWLVLLIFIVSTALVMLAQIRGARLAILPVVPAAAWLIIAARHAYLRNPRPLPAMGLVGSWLIFSGVILSLLVNAVLNVLPSERAEQVTAARASKLSCLAENAFIDLRALPPERIITPIDLGSHMLLETPHAVVAAPYHRNEDGVLDAFRFLNRPAEEARQIAADRGLGLFVTCPQMPEMFGAGLREPDTVLSLLAAGTPPEWLIEVSLDGPLKVYAIQP